MPTTMIERQLHLWNYRQPLNLKVLSCRSYTVQVSIDYAKQRKIQIHIDANKKKEENENGNKHTG